MKFSSFSNGKLKAAKISFIILIAISGLSMVSGADWEVYEGDSIVLDEANSSIEWGENYTFNASGLIEHNDTLEINRTGTTNNYNISVTSTNESQINSTLQRYDLSNTNLGYGDVLLKVNTSSVDGATASYNFNQIPSISSDEYVLKRDGNEYRTFDLGGKISWRYDRWESNHTFSLVYREVEDNSDDSSSSGGSSISTSSDSEISVNSNSRVWFESRRNFEINPGEVGPIRKVSVDTFQNQSSFSMNVRKLEEEPEGVESAGQAYSYTEIEVDATDEEIESSNIEFRVNSSFAESYDRIILRRYNDGSWQDLDTRRTDGTGDKWVYEASSTGFSYYAIVGHENQDQTDSTQEGSTDDGSRDTIDREDSSDSTTENQTYGQESENSENQSSLDSKTKQIKLLQKLKDEGVPVMVGILVLVLLLAGGHFGYSKYKERELNQMLLTLQEELKEDNVTVIDPDPVFNKLHEAEQLVEEGNYSEAEEIIEEAEEIII